MAWEWSHTSEAYENARLNVEQLPRETLLTVLREWAYDDRVQAGRRKSFRLPAGVPQLDTGLLVEKVWARTEELSLCDNRGFRCWICPNGCHTVPYDPPKTQEAKGTEE